MGMALLDDRVRHSLLTQQADGFLEAFGLSQESRDRLRALPATTLAELAQGIAQHL